MERVKRNQPSVLRINPISFDLPDAYPDFFDCTIDELVGRKDALLERVGVYDSEKLKLVATAMYGASGRVVKKFFQNVADTVLYYVNEDLETWQGTEEEILAAQRTVLELGALTQKESED